MIFNPRNIILLFLLTYGMNLFAQGSGSDSMETITMHGTYYSDRFVGRKTSSGEVFMQDKFTAAHRTLKFGTLLLVTNPKNGKEVIVRINDRCPRSQVLDMTRRAAQQIGVSSHRVEVKVLPDHYRPLWEAQELLSELMSEGRLKAMVDIGLSAQKILSSRADTTEQADAKKTDNVAVYDLELLRNANLSDAKSQVRRIPVLYQEYVKYVNAGRPGGVSVVLELTSTKQRVEAVKKELQAMFPDSKIVPSK